jgi:hypothetical protein
VKEWQVRIPVCILSILLILSFDLAVPQILDRIHEQWSLACGWHVIPPWTAAYAIARRRRLIEQHENYFQSHADLNDLWSARFWM